LASCALVKVNNLSILISGLNYASYTTRTTDFTVNNPKRDKTNIFVYIFLETRHNEVGFMIKDCLLRT
jgi:hypothetical protein